MIARLVQVTTKPGQLQDFIKAMAEHNFFILNNSRGLSTQWFSPRTHSVIRS